MAELEIVFKDDPSEEVLIKNIHNMTQRLVFGDNYVIVIETKNTVFKVGLHYGGELVVTRITEGTIASHTTIAIPADPKISIK